MLYFSELSTDKLQKIIDYLPDSARTVSINRLAGIFLKHYIHNLFSSGSVEKDGLQHPLTAHMVGYFGKEQTLKDQIKIYVAITAG